LPAPKRGAVDQVSIIAAGEYLYARTRPRADNVWNLGLSYEGHSRAHYCEPREPRSFAHDDLFFLEDWWKLSSSGIQRIRAAANPRKSKHEPNGLAWAETQVNFLNWPLLGYVLRLECIGAERSYPSSNTVTFD
jgi:hypothetical protein